MPLQCRSLGILGLISFCTQEAFHLGRLITSQLVISLHIAGFSFRQSSISRAQMFDHP